MAYKKAEFWNLNWGNEDTWLLKFLAYLPICSIEKFQSIPVFTYWLFSVCTCISHHWLSSRYLHQLDLGYYKVITFFSIFFQQGVPQREVPSRPLWNSTPVLTMKQCPEVEKPWVPFQKRAAFQTKPDQFREMETTRPVMDLSAMVEFCKVVEGGSHPKPIWW